MSPVTKQVGNSHLAISLISPEQQQHFLSTKEAALSMWTQKENCYSLVIAFKKRQRCFTYSRFKGTKALYCFFIGFFCFCSVFYFHSVTFLYPSTRVLHPCVLSLYSYVTLCINFLASHCQQKPM